MRPLKVTAQLVGAVAGEVPKLDSIIERAMAHRCEPAALRPPDEDGEYGPDGVPIPIARRRVGGVAWSIPLASWPIYAAQEDHHDFVHKRFDPPPDVLRPNALGVFYGNNGEFRGYRLPLRVRDVGRVVWFCVGDAKEVRRLLTHPRSGVRYLGKKGSIGYGLVKSWTVEPADDDWSWFAPSPAGTVLMRGLPASMPLPNDLVGFRKWYGGVAPPYWSPKYHVEMVEPC